MTRPMPTTRDAPANIRFAAWVAVGLTILGPLVLLGWIFDVGVLKQVIPGRPTMKVNTAVGLTLLGAALLTRVRRADRASRWCAALLTALALAHLWEHLTGFDLRIDQIFVTEALADGAGRMALITSAALACLGAGLWIDAAAPRRAAVLRDGLAVFAALLALGGFAGHLYGFYPLHNLGPGVATIALHTSIALLCAAVAVIAVHPESPLARVVLANRAGGRFARIVLPVALLLPLAAGGFRVIAHELGWFGMELGVLCMVLASIIGFGGATLLAAAQLNAADDRLLASNAALEETVVERTAELQSVVARLEAQSVFARGVLDSLSAGVAVLDAEGKVVQVNAEWRHVARTAGAATGEELIGTDYLAMCERAIGSPGAGSAADAVAGIRAVMRGERPLFTLEYPCDVPDGTRYWYLLRATPLAGHAGWVVAAHQDITEHKALELELASSENLLRSMGNMALIGGWELDVATGRSRWTEAVYRIHGIEPTAHPPLERALEFYAPEAWSAITSAVQAGTDRGEPWDLELPFVSADGRRLWVRARGAAEQENGRTVRLHGILQDVTDLHHAQQALRERETSYRSMFETNPHPMLVYDPTDFTILAVNAAAVHRYGWTHDEFLAMRVTDLHPPEELALVRDTVPTLDPGLATGIPWTHLTRDGERMEVEVASHGVTFEGRQGRLVLMHDVTERNRIERELRAKNAELERFTYTVSHDLKSPLVTVRTFAGYLADDLAAGDTAKVKSDLGYITHAADRMGRLLDELLELSRVGRNRNPPVQTSFREIAEGALRLTAGAVSRAGARVELDDADVALYGDRTRLTQIWQNLIDNAAKFMGGQSRPHIHVGLREAGTETAFFVRDNGIGIDPRHSERIFGLFDKLDGSTDGTGVGLALVRRIVELYGGRINVESAGAGHGSCFIFTLPDARRPAP
jgi:PAS domain S-box-containing protein